MRFPYCTGALIPAGKGAAAVGAASRTLAVVGAMFGHHQGGGLGQVLAGSVAGSHCQRHRRAAARAGRRQMIDHLVRRGDLEQSFALLAFLPARRPSRWFARAPRALVPWRLVEPVARRRLAAVRTVQPQPALKLSNLRFERCILGRQRRDQRKELFPRPLGVRLRIRP
jgi:hypothetical protein